MSMREVEIVFQEDHNSKSFNIEIDENILVSKLTEFMKAQYDLDLIVLNKDREYHADVNQSISKYIQKGIIYAKSSTTKVTLYCEQNVKLQKYSLNLDLNQTITEFKRNNLKFQGFLFVDKNNVVAQGKVKLSNIVQRNIDRDYFLRYKEIPDYQAQKEKNEKNQYLKQIEILLEENSGRMYWPYFKNQPFSIRKRIIDFQKSTIQATNCYQFEERQTKIYQESKMNKIQNLIQENINKIQEIPKLGVSTPLVKVSLKYSYEEEKQNMTKRQNQKLFQNSKQYTVYNAITDAYHIDIENIALKESIRNEVKKLYYMYEKQDSEFKSQAIQFFKNYGTHLQIGKYLFGSRYGFTSIAQCHHETSLQKLTTVSRVVKNLGLTGAPGTEGGYGVFSDQGGFQIKNITEPINSKLNQDQKSRQLQYFSYEIKYKLDGIEVKNRDIWRQICGTNKKNWKIMGFQDIKLVRIVDILRNQCNVFDNPTFKKTYKQFLNDLSNIETKSKQEK